MIPGLDTIAAKIAGAAVIGLALALALVMWRADSISKQRDEYQRQAIETGLKLGVSNQSIATLEATIADLNKQAEQRAEAFAEAQRLAEEREAENERLGRESDRRIARLREFRPDPAEPCETPAELVDLARGL